ncbi:MAG: hypothetical protein KC620_09105 [Myxococcales bacterium]|nr:hypothetical protein [Myxococcales bacterium]
MTSTQVDLRYQDLIDEARARIPALAPEWTDHNPSDPGIAILELLAWLTETVLYRSTRLTDGGRQAILGLITGTDPDANLRGSALDDALRNAIKAWRAPFRVITPEDYRARLLEDWPKSPAALALGQDGALGALKVLRCADLSADDPDTVRHAHVSVVVVPGGLEFKAKGTVRTATPRLIVRRPRPETVNVWLPNGAAQLSVGVLDLKVEVLRVADRPRGSVQVDMPAGVQVYTLDAESALSGGTITTPTSWRKMPTEGAEGLLSVFYLPARRTGFIQVVVSTPAAVPLRLELCGANGGLWKTAEGVGHVVVRGKAGSFGAADNRWDWQLRLFSTDPNITEVEATANATFYEETTAWDAGGDLLLDPIWDFLDPRRLVTVRHHVVGPTWVPVSLSASIYLSEGYRSEFAMDLVLHALLDRFGPPQGERGHPLGRALYATDVYACIEAVEGVDYVENLTLTPGEAGGLLTDDGEAHGVRFDRGEALCLDLESTTLTFFERR